MRLYSAGCRSLAARLGVYERSGALLIDESLGIHAGEDACAADGHIGVLLSDKHRGAYGVVSAACGVRTENTDQNRNTELCKLCIAVERGASAAASGEQKLLLVELNAGAVEQIYKRDAQDLGGVRSLQQVLRLSGHPCARSLLIVGCHYDSPFSPNTANTLHHAGRTVFIIVGVIETVERAPCAVVDKRFYALHRSKLALLVERFVAAARSQRVGYKLLDLFLDLDYRISVLVVLAEEGLADGGHILKIPGHGITVCAHFILQSFMCKIERLYQIIPFSLYSLSVSSDRPPSSPYTETLSSPSVGAGFVTWGFVSMSLIASPFTCISPMTGW